MTGLEKILKAIGDEAQANADAVIAQADKQAGEILTAAKLEAEKSTAQIIEKSKADVKDAINRAESAAALQERRIILEAKQQIIGDTITKARVYFDHLPAPEFTDVILRLARKYAHNKTGKIVFSDKDKSRLPANINEKLIEVLADQSGAVLTVSEDTADINGGFLLVYGDIEENCSFDALFSAAKDILQDKVNSLLFE